MTQLDQTDTRLVVSVEDEFIKHGSEIGDIFQATIIDGSYVTLSDFEGWAVRFKVADLRSYVKVRGKLATWDDFAELADLESQNVSSK